MGKETLILGKNRIGHIDVLRGIAIVLMVMGHTDFGSSFDHYIHTFHMPVWFFITGWFSDKDFFSLKFVKKKALQLLVPYFVCGIIHYPIWLIMNMSADNKVEPILNLLWVNTNLNMPIAGALWFLTCLFFAEILFALCRKYSKSNSMLSIECGIFVILGHIFNEFLNFRLPWAIDVSLISIGFIWLGYEAHNLKDSKIVNKLLNMNLLETIVLFLFSVIGAFLNGYVNMRTGSYSNIFLFWVNASISILFLWNASKLLEMFEPIQKSIGRFLKFVGRHSMCFLLFNQLTIVVQNKVYKKLLGDYSETIPIRIAVVVITISVIGYIIYLLETTTWGISLRKKKSL